MSMFSFNKNPNDTINNNKNMMTEENTNGAGVNMGADNSLVMQDTLVGGGEMAVNGKSITANYTGMLQDGTVFDSSVGRAPFTFTLGAGMVIRGWDKGIEGMKVGGKRRLIIAPDMAYGSAGITAPDGKVIIPENATLVFDVELLGVK
ncbi:FKBP-type peptidyl-prolyl cis-trans isomerase [Candidatus Parcubacteria bacterium]|nr:FKBP-type peptidyl-prolyl cis-trans isomerase [Candidatus Parcubacteria bacterium]